jgi:ABC-type enterochelin transport system substrate-binding protein
VTYTFKFTFEEYTKDNQDYLLVIDSKMVIDPQSMKIYYRNFFKDKVLDDAFSRELTANWKKVVAYFMPIYFDSYAQSYGNMFNRFLEKVSFAELFDGV